VTAREQCIEMIGEEFTKKWETLPPELKMVMAGITKTDFGKQTSHIHTFKVGSSHQKKKQNPKQYPKQQTQTTNVQSQSETIIPDSQIASQTSEQQQQNPTEKPFKSKKQDFASKKQFKGQRNSNFSPPSFGQQKQFFKQFENQTSRRPSYKSGGTIDPYSPDVAPMNIFENQVVPTGIHNLSKIFRPNLATICVLSLGMKFVPKSDTLKWKNMFSSFEKLLELLFGTKIFG